MNRGTDENRREEEGEVEGRGRSAPRELEHEEEEETKVIYLYRRGGRQQAEVALQIGSEKKTHVIMITEALEDQKRLPSHAHTIYVGNQNTCRYTRERTGTSR